MLPLIVNKKRKIVGSSNELIGKIPAPSKIFSPFRSIGNVTNNVPFAIGTLGRSYYIVTSVGRLFQIYDASTLRLLFVSQQRTESEITCLYAHFQHVYCGFDNRINIYKRGTLLHSLECKIPHVKDSDIKVSKIIQFGEFLVGISSINNYIFIFKKPEDNKLPIEFYSYIKVNESYGNVNNLIHPPTYLNKIIVTTESNIFIYNIKTLKLVHKSKYVFSNESYGLITSIECPPALDIIALGTSQSNILLLNFKSDKILKKIELSQQIPVTSISFRTDDAAHMVAGFSSGDLIFYDLNNNFSRIHILHAIHKSGISNVKFLNGQPIFLTNGDDNHLREFVFDPSLSTNNNSKKAVVPPPRHLRSRGGHALPPSVITFTDRRDHFMLSGSQDQTFWSFSLRKDSQSQEMSQKPQKSANNKREGGFVSNIKEKIPKMISIAFSEARQKDWENVLTGHENEKFARTWSFESKRLGRWKLLTNDDGLVKSVCISTCGNFGLIGSSNGSMLIYNLQSGVLRKQIKFHSKAVTGIAIDNMNSNMCSVSLDGIIGFYNFNESKLIGKIDLESPITLLRYHAESDLVAVALDDLTIIVIDVITKRIVRQLIGHSNRITALDFSPNGRWLVSASLDSTIRTWDLPTGGCIDGFKIDNIVTNLRFSPTGNFLATTHVSGNGISLWNNKSQFKAISTKHVTEDKFGIMKILPNSSGDGGSNLVEEAIVGNEESFHLSNIIDNYKTVDQISKDLITLSVGPRNKFNTLIHLDTIRKRNKPKEAPKKPELTPFFLQGFGKQEDAKVTIDLEKIGGNSDLQLENEDEDVLMSDIDGKIDPTEAAMLTRIANDNAIKFENRFTRLLNDSLHDDDKSKTKSFLLYLVNLSPSNLELEIKSLNLLQGTEELTILVKALTCGISILNNNFDLYQAIMNIVLRCHGDIIYEKLDYDENLNEAFDEWDSANKLKANNMDELIKNCSGIINFISTL